MTSDLQWSAEDQEYVEKVVSVADYYYIENETLKIALSEEALLNDYHFTEEQHERLMTDVIGTTVYNEDVEIPMTRASIKNGALYISHDELVGGAFSVMATAAAAGPAAMAAALTAVASAFSGPVGTILGTIASVAAVPSLVELCGRVTYAVATGQGIYIKPVLSYPPLEFGYWMYIPLTESRLHGVSVHAFRPLSAYHPDHRHAAREIAITIIWFVLSYILLLIIYLYSLH